MASDERNHVLKCGKPVSESHYQTKLITMLVNKILTLAAGKIPRLTSYFLCAPVVSGLLLRRLICDWTDCVNPFAFADHAGQPAGDHRSNVTSSPRSMTHLEERGVSLGQIPTARSVFPIPTPPLSSVLVLASTRIKYPYTTFLSITLLRPGRHLSAVLRCDPGSSGPDIRYEVAA
jgi:hypothetical protein